MRVYVDTSALLKRVVLEPETAELSSALVGHGRQGDAIVCSSLGWIEVTRALRAHPRAGDDERALTARCDAALSGVAAHPISAEVVALARRLPPNGLRSDDAIHLASAILTDVDVLIAYDRRLVDAARVHGLRTSSPAA